MNDLLHMYYRLQSTPDNLYIIPGNGVKYFFLQNITIYPYLPIYYINLFNLDKGLS